MVIWYCVCVWECCIMGPGLGRAWLPRPRLVTVDTTNTSSGQQPPPGRRERASEEYFTQRQNPAQLLLTAPPWGCSTVRKHFILLHWVFTFMWFEPILLKWENDNAYYVSCKCWRCKFKMQNRLLSRLLFCARSTFWIEDYCAVTFNFAGIIAKKCCKGESFNLFQ